MHAFVTRVSSNTPETPDEQVEIQSLDDLLTLLDKYAPHDLMINRYLGHPEILEIRIRDEYID